MSILVLSLPENGGFGMHLYHTTDMDPFQCTKLDGYLSVRVQKLSDLNSFVYPQSEAKI